MSLEQKLTRREAIERIGKGLGFAAALGLGIMPNTANAEESKLERAIKAYEEGKSSGIPKLSLKDLEGYKKQSELDFVHSLDLKGRQVINFKTKNGTRTAIIFDYPHLGSATIHNYQVGKYNVGILTLPNAEVFGFIIQRDGKKQIMYIDFDNDGRIDYANEVSGYFPWQKLKKPYGWNSEKKAFEISVQDYYNKIAKPVNDNNMPKGLRVGRANNLLIYDVRDGVYDNPIATDKGEFQNYLFNSEYSEKIKSIFLKYGVSVGELSNIIAILRKKPFSRVFLFNSGYMGISEEKDFFLFKIPQGIANEIYKL